MEVLSISSLQNPRIKDLISLQTKSRERRNRSVAVIEGEREFERAIKGGFEVESVFFCRQYLRDEEIIEAAVGARMFEVSVQVYDKIAYRGGTEGIVAIIKTVNLSLSDVICTKNPLFLVLESVEKPGNLGAVLRTADAAGVDAVIVCDPLTDLYNPNTVRASLGAIFTVQVVVCDSASACSWLKNNGVRVITAQLQDSVLYYDTDMKRATALVFGTEDKGLSDFWREQSDARIRIPMAGVMDSLNVSVSAAVLCFEAVRQRNVTD